VRAASLGRPGVHLFSLTATQAGGRTVTARGNLEIVPWQTSGLAGPKVNNIVILLGDGTGAGRRTAARIVEGGCAQAETIAPLAIETFQATGMVKTASLNSVLTDPSHGMTSYASGNRNNGNEEGVCPDVTVDRLDSPRAESPGEFLHRMQNQAPGLFSAADVFDATPAGNAVHASPCGAGSGIVDQCLRDRDRDRDRDRNHAGLLVPMGGGRKWLVPAAAPGSACSERNEYALSPSDAYTAEIVRRWGVAPGAIDMDRDPIADSQRAGFACAPAATRSTPSMRPGPTGCLAGSRGRT
jgi:alkaline phosphatase